PMHPWQMNLGFIAGGFVRALMIGVALTALAIPLTNVPLVEPLVLAAAVVLSLILFSALGTVVGIFADQWDHTAFVTNVVILPLAFVGGVFYSVELLPSPWEEISHVNPIFYLVQAVRYGFLGASDVSPILALGVTAALAIPTYLWAQWLFSSGRKLKD
ncbi:MAG: ABC transporter permease, partial [Thermoleophilaceae bacterium]|nr:ABC transporter permease [Thermoleophilaceae bacterium]